MKKNFLSIVVSLVFFGSLQAQSGYTVTGEITALKEPSKIFLKYLKNGEWMADSIITKNGKFLFKGSIDRPREATLIRVAANESEPMDYKKRMVMDYQVFYLENTKVSVQGTSLRKATVEGGKTQNEYLALQAQLKPLQDEIDPMVEKMVKYGDEKNESAQNKLLPRMREIRGEMGQISDNFIEQYPDSYVSLDMVVGKGVVINPEYFEPFFNKLSDRLHNTKDGKELKERLEIAKSTSVGNPALDFSQKDVEGKDVSLSSLKGKYILLDFWASWCGPCRAENPHVLKAYNQFKDKNFDVLAVSLDENRDAWIKAIKDDGMPWTQVSDLKGFNNAAALLYGIKAIPQNFLIDPSGKIIATNLRGDMLEKTLNEMIKN